MLRNPDSSAMATPIQPSIKWGGGFSSMIRKPSDNVSLRWSRASGDEGTSDPCGSLDGQRLRDCLSTGPSSLPSAFNLQRLIAYSNSFPVGYGARGKPNDLPESPAPRGKLVRASAPRRPHSFHLGVWAPGPGPRSPAPGVGRRTNRASAALRLW